MPGRKGRAQALEDELHCQGGHDQAHEAGQQAPAALPENPLKPFGKEEKDIGEGEDQGRGQDDEAVFPAGLGPGRQDQHGGDGPGAAE